MLRRSRSLVVAFGVLLGVIAGSACNREAATTNPGPLAASATPAPRIGAADPELMPVIRKLCESAGGDVGVAIVQVETGHSVDLEGAKKLPLYSVFKLPLALTVLKDVEEQRLKLDQEVRVTPDDVAPGSQFNTD